MILIFKENNGEQYAEDYYEWISVIYDVPDEINNIIQSWKNFILEESFKNNIEVSFSNEDYSISNDPTLWMYSFVTLTGKSLNENNFPKSKDFKILKNITNNFSNWLEKTYSIKKLKFLEIN